VSSCICLTERANRNRRESGRSTKAENVADSAELKGKNMASLFAAALFFDGIHFLVSGSVLRTKIVGLIGGSPLTMYLEK